MIATAVTHSGERANSSFRAVVVLVHSAWFDGSCWNEVISRLQSRGVSVLAVRNPLQSLAGDVALLRRVLADQTHPVVVVGHGWGGTVMTQAVTAENAVALVYVSAFAPDLGESTRDLKAWQPVPEQRRLLHADAAGFLHFNPAHFPYHVAHDLPLIHANVLAALDAPIHGDALDDAIDTVAWRQVPTWFVVTSHDRMIPPALQRQMAVRMHAQVREVYSSHAAFLSRPREITDVICEAVALAS